MSGRYTILGPIARGGMAAVYLGRMTGSAGFTRLVAIKRLHPEMAAQRELIAMLVDEARVATQIRHPNVIDTLDLVVSDGAFSLVLEYVDGDALSALVARARELGEDVPRPIALAIVHGMLRGLDAAHEARSADGHPLGIVHRDVSPQNVLVGVDGVPRVIDFGVAKAVGRLEATRPGEVRGKLAYMAPEQLQARPVTRQVDVYAAGVILWELLTGERLFTADDERVVCAAVLRGDIPKPSERRPDVPAELDAIVLRATAHDLGERHLTARELASELEPFERASDEEVGAWVKRLSAERRAQRQRLVDGTASPSDLRSIEDVMGELAAAAPPSASASGMEIAAPAAPPARRVQLAALVAGVVLVLVAAGIGFRTARSTASGAAHSDAPQFPPAPIVLVPPSASAEPEEPAPPLASAPPSSSAPPKTAPPAKPVRKAVRPARGPAPDPASYR
jgi:serine/threonine-protein kinase